MTKYFLNNKTNNIIDFAGLVIKDELVEVTANIAANAVKDKRFDVLIKNEKVEAKVEVKKVAKKKVSKKSKKSKK